MELTRNELIVKLKTGENPMTLEEIAEELVKKGFPRISKTRVGAIWMHSPHYQPTKKKSHFCNFCKNTRKGMASYNIAKYGEYKVRFKICANCIANLLGVVED